MKLKIHIATLFILVFTLPMVYQSVHITLFHGVISCERQCEHGSLGHDHHSNSHNEGREGFQLLAKTKDHSCTICDYRVNVNQAPEICLNALPCSRPFSSITQKAVNKPHIFNISQSIPRAPPIQES